MLETEAAEMRKNAHEHISKERLTFRIHTEIPVKREAKC